MAAINSFHFRLALGTVNGFSVRALSFYSLGVGEAKGLDHFVGPVINSAANVLAGLFEADLTPDGKDPGSIELPLNFDPDRRISWFLPIKGRYW